MDRFLKLYLNKKKSTYLLHILEVSFATVMFVRYNHDLLPFQLKFGT